MAGLLVPGEARTDVLDELVCAHVARSFHDGRDEFAELGADYIGFGPASPSDIDGIDQCAELIAWWAGIFVVPCVAFNIDGTDAALKLATRGADFIATSRLIWREDDAINRIAEIGRAISGVRRAA